VRLRISLYKGEIAVRSERGRDDFVGVHCHLCGIGCAAQVADEALIREDISAELRGSTECCRAAHLPEPVERLPAIGQAHHRAGGSGECASGFENPDGIGVTQSIQYEIACQLRGRIETIDAGLECLAAQILIR